MRIAAFHKKLIKNNIYMKTSTLRTIAELNAQPLIRVSKMSIIATVLFVLTVIFSEHDISLLLFLASAFACNEHVLWCDARHNRKEIQHEN